MLLTSADDYSINNIIEMVLTGGGFWCGVLVLVFFFLVRVLRHLLCSYVQEGKRKTIYIY